MIIGEILNTSATAVYTPPVPRGGDKASFVIECIQIAGTTPSIAVDIEHKNSADTSWAAAASFTAITAAGTSQKDASGLKEQIRLKFAFSGTGGWARIFIYPPAWQS